jgi:DNA-binding NtrC family response regulator
MRAIFEKLTVLAPTTVSVLIEGETGTGKELVAQAKGTGAIDLAAHLHERPAPKGKGGGHGGVTSRPGHTYASSKKEHDRHYFKGLYEATKGNVSEMSKRAELNRETVRIYLKELGIGTYGG